MRLFTGIDLAPNVVDRLAALLRELRPLANINWSPLENLHITSKFIGEWPDARMDELRSALTRIPVSGAIAISVKEFGFFPGAQHPHSFFAGVNAESALAELAAAIDDGLAPLGCSRENKPYRPHVTLARIKRNSEIGALRKHLSKMKDVEFGSFEARAFHLYLSQPGARTSVYTKLATYDLMRETKEIR